MGQIYVSELHNGMYAYILSLHVMYTLSVLWISLLGDQPGADLGPLISPEAKQRVCDLVQSGVDEGASVSV